MPLIRSIAQLGHPVLREPARPVDLPAPEATPGPGRGHAGHAPRRRGRGDRRPAGLRGGEPVPRRLEAQPPLSRRPGDGARGGREPRDRRAVRRDGQGLGGMPEHPRDPRRGPPAPANPGPLPDPGRRTRSTASSRASSPGSSSTRTTTSTGSSSSTGWRAPGTSSPRRNSGGSPAAEPVRASRDPGAFLQGPRGGQNIPASSRRHQSRSPRPGEAVLSPRRARRNRGGRPANGSSRRSPRTSGEPSRSRRSNARNQGWAGSRRPGRRTTSASPAAAGAACRTAGRGRGRPASSGTDRASRSRRLRSLPR